MTRARLVPLVIALAASAFAAPSASAAPGNCVAAQPGKPYCSVQTAGGAFEISCIFATSHCVAYIDGSTYRTESGWGWTGYAPYGTYLGISVHGTAGLGTVNTSN
ncbi:MAG TPA: hypothetical protein VNA20_13515 [Frankiaceae bacterium]|nr:hypothetical protein [Frankiaceae bacterium]